MYVYNLSGEKDMLLNLDAFEFTAHLLFWTLLPGLFGSFVHFHMSTEVDQIWVFCPLSH